MPLTEPQITEIKNQLVSQIKKSFPEERKEFATKKIESMNGKELEEFLKNNNLSLENGQQCIFCSIISGKIPSYKIAENSSSIAVLEINPVSKGHTLIIPKKHVTEKEKLPPEVDSLAKEVSKKIKSKLKPLKIKKEIAHAFGHEVINLIPIYKGQKIGERREEPKNNLSRLQKELFIKPKPKQPPKIEKPKTEKISENIRLPRRIP